MNAVSRLLMITLLGLASLLHLSLVLSTICLTVGTLLGCLVNAWWTDKLVSA